MCVCVAISLTYISISVYKIYIYIFIYIYTVPLIYSFTYSFIHGLYLWIVNNPNREGRWNIFVIFFVDHGLTVFS